MWIVICGSRRVQRTYARRHCLRWPCVLNFNSRQARVRCAWAGRAHMSKGYHRSSMPRRQPVILMWIVVFGSSRLQPIYTRLHHLRWRLRAVSDRRRARVRCAWAGRAHMSKGYHRSSMPRRQPVILMWIVVFGSSRLQPIYTRLHHLRWRLRAVSDRRRARVRCT